MLRGSDNQRIIILKQEYRSLYEAYLSAENSKIQNFTTREGIISVGIHLPGYEEALKRAATAKGLKEKDKEKDKEKINKEVEKDG